MFLCRPPFHICVFIWLISFTVVYHHLYFSLNTGTQMKLIIMRLYVIYSHQNNNPSLLPLAKRRKSSVGSSLKRLRQQLEQQTTDNAAKNASRKTRRSGIDLVKQTHPEHAILQVAPLTRWSSDNNLIEKPKVNTPRKISLNIASILRSTSHEPKDLLKAKLKTATSPPVIYLPDNVYHTIHHEPSRYRRRIGAGSYPTSPSCDSILPVVRTRSWTDISEHREHHRRISRRDPFYTHYENKYLESLEDAPEYYPYRSYPRDLSPYSQSTESRDFSAYRPPQRDLSPYTPTSPPQRDIFSPPPLDEYRPLERTSYRVSKSLQEHHILLSLRGSNFEVAFQHFVYLCCIAVCPGLSSL